MLIFNNIDFQERMESELNCTVCGNQYRSDNIPRLLTACGHTYCENCLDTMMTEEQDGRHRVACPEDETITYLESNDVTQFPKNIALLRVIENKSVSNAASFKDESFEITKIHRKEDSHGDESEREIINQIQSGKDFNSSREENCSKEQVTNSKVKVSAKQEYELCLPHQKPMDIVCLEDMIKICAKCAIFGQHKGHEFKSIEQIEEQWDSFREDIINIYARKESLEKHIYNEENARNILAIFEQNKRKLQKELSDRFKKLRDAIKKVEQATARRLEEVNLKAEQMIKELLQLDPAINNEYKAWEDKSFGLIIQTEECSLEEKLKNLLDYNNTRMVPQGEAVLLKIKQQEAIIPTRVQSIVKGIRLHCQEEILLDVEKYLTISYIQDQSGSQAEIITERSKSQPTFEESLLESDTVDNKPEPIYSGSMSSYEAYQSYQIYQQESIPRPPSQKAETTSYRISSSITPTKSKEAFFVQSISGEASMFDKAERPPKKKLKLIKVPEKIQKILEQLYNDSLDVLDLTNAELGDSVVVQICQFLRGTKVRSVKFIRNKLSDEVIPRMMFALGSIITMNLSQNNLTEHALDYLIANRNLMPNMKSIILSQNRIIERKHKNHIDRLRKLDLTVSV